MNVSEEVYSKIRCSRLPSYKGRSVVRLRCGVVCLWSADGPSFSRPNSVGFKGRYVLVLVPILGGGGAGREAKRKHCVRRNGEWGLLRAGGQILVLGFLGLTYRHCPLVFPFSESAGLL